MGGGSYTLDPDLTAYVRSVGNKIAKYSNRTHLPYEFVVINDSTPNAWALPGGKIAIHRGLLTELQDESELAAVLAHEIVHADARHSAQSPQSRCTVNAISWRVPPRSPPRRRPPRRTAAPPRAAADPRPE